MSLLRSEQQQRSWKLSFFKVLILLFLEKFIKWENKFCRERKYLCFLPTSRPVILITGTEEFSCWNDFWSKYDDDDDDYSDTRDDVFFFQFPMLKHSCLQQFLFLHSFKETIEDGCDYISFWWIFCSNPIQYKIDVIPLPYCYQDWCKIWKWPENKFDENYLFFALIISNMKSNK